MTTTLLRRFPARPTQWLGAALLALLAATAAIPPVQAGDQAGKAAGVTAYIGQGWG
jgi:hypothetical protein